LVTIPGISSGAGVQVYLSGLYTFLISVVGVVAMGAIVIGGARYLTSAGNPSAIEDAKHTIYSAIIGLLLAITSWVIIWEINPDVTVLKNPAMPWEAVGYSPGDSGPQCALPLGNGTAAAPCICTDEEKVIAIAVGPFVVTTTPASCESSVSTLLPFAIVIKYSEIMDHATVATITAFNFNPAINVSSITADSTSGKTIVAIDLSVALVAGTEYQVTVKGDGTHNISASGVPMPADYVFKFTTSAPPYSCASPPTGSFCNRVCSDPNLAVDGIKHCGSRYVRLKMNTYKLVPLTDYGTSDGIYFFFDNNAELWEFFLLNKGKHDLLNLPNTDSITVGTDIYDCALYLSERFWGGLEDAATIWVKTDIEIDGKGNSIRQNIMDSAATKGILNPFVGCDVSPNPPGCDAVNFEGFGSRISRVKNIWNGHYTNNNILKDKCGDCSFSISNTQMRPVQNLICDPNTKSWRNK